MFVDLVGSGIDLVKRMQSGGDMEISWIVFDHVKQLCNWTIMACHICDNKHCKILTITCCDIQMEDSQAHMVFWDNLNVMICPIYVSRISWWIVLKLIGLLWGGSMVMVRTSQFPLRFMNVRASSIGPPIWIKLYRSIPTFHWNISTSSYVKSTKTPRLWQKLTSNTSASGMVVVLKRHHWGRYAWFVRAVGVLALSL